MRVCFACVDAACTPHDSRMFTTQGRAQHVFVADANVLLLLLLL